MLRTHSPLGRLMLKHTNHAIRLIAAALLMTACIALSACDSTLFKEKNYLTRPISEEELRRIEAIDLSQQSRTPPETVEQAAERVIKEVVAPTTAPATVSLTIEDVRAAALENNLDLKVEVLNPAIAQTDVDAERAKFEAVFFANARRSVTDSPAVLGTEGSQTTFDSYGLGEDIPLKP